MLKTYTKGVLGLVVFLYGILGPYSIHFSQSHEQITVQDNIVYADTGDAQSQTPTTNSDLAIVLESVLKVVYVFLRPLLWIAGLAMDNSLVYGEIFGLDSALFKFWSIMKNFANFALGFLFVRSIVQYVINPNEKKNPKDMVIKLLIAGVGVQLSWFLIGALVDISTLLTVGIGGLPLQLISSSEIANKPIFGVKTSIKLNDKIGTTDNLVALFTWPGATLKDEGSSTTKQYILPCYFKDGKVVWGDERKTAFGVTDSTSSITGTNVGRNQVMETYCIDRGNVIEKKLAEVGTDGGINVRDNEVMRNIYSGSLVDLKKNSGCESNDVCQTLKTFTKKTEGYQGAFYSLYASLLNLSTIQIGVPKGDVSVVMETLIKVVIALAYIVPLAILAIILIMRIGYLWLIIAFSPFIVLASVKDLGFGGMKDKVDNKALKKAFDLKNVISLLLLPVIVTFTISLSIVFLSSLSEGLTAKGSAQSIGIFQRTEGSYRCYDVAITNICIDMPSREIGTGVFDQFSWMIMNLFGVGLMWFAVMAALKSSEFTKGIAEGVQKLSQDALMSAPIIPLGSGKSTSLGAIQEFPRDVSNRIAASNSASSEVLSNAIQGFVSDATGKDKAGNKVLTEATKNTDNIKKGQTNTYEEIGKTIKNVASNSSAFDGTKLDFGQYDSSLRFANSLATAAGVEQFKNGQELFTTDRGQKLLGQSLGAAGMSGDELRSMYSSKSDNDTKILWARDSKAIKKYIPLGTPTGKDSYENSTTKQKYTIKDKKDLSINGKTLTDFAKETTTKPLEKNAFDTLITDLNTMKTASMVFELPKDGNKADIEFTVLEGTLQKKYIITLDKDTYKSLAV